MFALLNVFPELKPKRFSVYKDLRWEKSRNTVTRKNDFP